MIAYLNGRFLPKEEIKISPDDRGFLFADGAYEVIRAYRGRLFRTEDHFTRFEKSLKGILLPLPDLQAIRVACGQLLEDNGLARSDALVYIQVTRGAAPRKHAFPENVPPTVYATVSSFQPYPAEYREGVRVILVPDLRWGCCNIKSIALLPNVLAMQQAKESGAQEAVFVRDGIVTEGSHTTVCAVMNNRLVTHPLNNRVLSGVTRKAVLELCRDLDVGCEESPIPAHLLTEASELLILSTTKEIMPVIRVDGRQVGNGKPGPVARKLVEAFRRLASG